MLRLQKAMLHRVLLAKARPILQKPSAPIHFPSRLVVRSRSTAQLQRPARLSTRALNSQLVHQSLKQPRQQPRILASSSPSLSSTSSVPLASGGGGGHVPPLLVRGSLVGATTALLTPLFPIIGFNQLVFRFVSPAGRVAIHGGTSMLYFSAMVLAPDAFFYAPVLLPFAIGNGVVASAAYVVAEGVAGGPAALAAMKIGPVPVAGPLIGAATALLAPNVYPACFAVVWPNLGPGSSSYVFDPAAYEFIQALCYNEVMIPCLAITGGASGLLIHSLLRPLVVGRVGGDWRKAAGAVLVALAVALGAMYSTAARTHVPHLRELTDLDEAVSKVHSLFGFTFGTKQVDCYIDGEEELLWVPGLDPRTGHVCSRRRRLPGSASSTGAPQPPQQQRSGLHHASESCLLRAQLQDPRVRCFRSAKHAFFSFAGEAPISRDTIRKLAEELPQAETPLTDALVAVVAKRAPPSEVELGLAKVLPFLAASPLADRLRRGINPLRKRSWADEANKVLAFDLQARPVNEVPGRVQRPSTAASAAMKTLIEELDLRAAELRELLRLRLEEQEELESQSTGRKPAHFRRPYTASQLQASLAAAGIEVERAISALAEIGYTPTDALCETGSRSRPADILSLQGRDVQVQWQQAGGLALSLAAVVAIGAAGAALLSRHSS